MKVFLVDPGLHRGIDPPGEGPLRLDIGDPTGPINIFPTRTKPPLAFLYFLPLLEEAGIDVSMLSVGRLLRRRVLDADDLYGSWTRLVGELGPSVFAFTTNAQTYPTVVNLSRCCKEVSAANVVLHGGPQASAVGPRALELFPWIDTVVVGEAEAVLVRLLKRLLATGGSEAVSAPRVVAPPPPRLDALPLPAFGAPRLKDYLEAHGRPHLLMETSRGCPYACRFCSTSRIRFREKSVPRMSLELRRVAEVFPPTAQITFVSNFLFATEERTRSFCEAVEQASVGYPWGCFARSDGMSGSTLRRMRDAGCKVVHYGLETGSPRMQRTLRKNLDLDVALATVAQTLDAGLCATVNFIIGFPEETRETLDETLDCIRRLRSMGARIYPTVLSPHYGTDYHRVYRQRLVFNEYRRAEVFCDADERLIRRFPDVFSFFYYAQPDHLPLAELESLYLRLLDEVDEGGKLRPAVTAELGQGSEWAVAASPGVPTTELQR